MLNLCSDDIREKAEQAAERAGGAHRGFRFEDVCWKTTQAIRANPGLDVFLECVPEYDAHANLVILATDVVDHLAESAAPKLNHQIFRDIAAMLDIWAANDLAAFEAMRQPPFERPNQ
jgi:hypothetical protein